MTLPSEAVKSDRNAGIVVFWRVVTSAFAASSVVCNAGIITITDAALVIGNTYHLAVKTANGWLGVSDGVTAS